jgi:SWI/SNF-related matrix-associated actin-dependent regulator 1 of chromatin subfamily A
MGLGKTLQALALALYYGYFPLLIVCPSYLRFNWKAEILKWTDIPETDIKVMLKGKDVPDNRVNLVSYGLVPRMQDTLRRFSFKTVICDESHYIKSPKAQRTKATMPLLRKAAVALCLTGTPLANRPSEAYTQAAALRPCYFGSYSTYTKRYCDAKMSIFGWDVSGQSNMAELHALLHKTILLRRLKKDVLKQLPDKRRAQVLVPIDKTFVKEVAQGMAAWKALNVSIFKAPPNSEAQRTLIFERKALISQLYHLNASAKQKVCADYLLDTLQQVQKVVVFCVHKVLIKSLEAVLVNKGLGFMRIDGSVASEVRQERVDQFQQSPACRVALLSLGAASTGLTLTASSTMLFFEHSWTPATMLQAEDRIHRIGQTNKCSYSYVLGENTIDVHIFKTLEKKLAVTGNVLDKASVSITGEEERFEPVVARADEDMSTPFSALGDAFLELPEC